MAIRPIMIPAARAPANLQQDAQMAARAEQAADALQAVNLSPKPTEIATKGPRVSLVAPLHQADNRLDAQGTHSGEVSPKPSTRQVQTSPARVEPQRRDSLKRRNALLKGKEGSRQRRRWENDRLLNNPWAQPPLPTDWEVHPTYPRHAVPYYLAPLWDAEAFERSIERKMKGKKQGTRAGISPAEEAASNVPKEVRSKLKQARAAKGLLQDLEEEIRKFLREWNEKESKRQEIGFHDIDSEEEEIVFVGRNGQMHDSPTRNTTPKGLGREKLVFHGLATDGGASFA